jgi:hypothetical protein
VIVGLPDVEGGWQSGKIMGKAEFHQFFDFRVRDEDQDEANFEVDIGGD